MDAYNQKLPKWKNSPVNKVTDWVWQGEGQILPFPKKYCHPYNTPDDVWYNNNNNNDRLTAFDPGQPG